MVAAQRFSALEADCLRQPRDGVCSLAIYSPTLPFAARYAACLLFSLVGGLLPASVLGGRHVRAQPELVATTNGLLMQGGNSGRSSARRSWPSWFPWEEAGNQPPGYWGLGGRRGGSFSGLSVLEKGELIPGKMNWRWLNGQIPGFIPSPKEPER